MADISQYLQDILDAVYGEQVRGSIHDAIEIINDVSEVVISAGTAVSSATSSSTGFFVTSLYINTTTCDLWKCIGTDSWQKIANLKGIGIASLAKTSTAANVDTYTITFDDGSTETFNVTNGIDGTNGSTWYKGTALSGTGSAIVGFPGVVNDFYLNSTTGGVYVCTKTGGAMVPDAAEWDYVMTLSGGGGGGSIVVIDNLTSGSSTDALSANQGRVLKGMVDGKADTSSLAQVATSGSYNDLTNKPTIPAAANDGELAIQQNGTSKGTFTANQSSNTTVDIITDDWAGTATVTSGAISFSSVDDSNNNGYEVFIQVTSSSTNKNPSAQLSTISGEGTSSMSVTYTTDADNGATAKLRRIK